MSITCYLDESATDGSTPCAVVGGLILGPIDHQRLVSDWVALITKFNLKPGLHMKEFGRGGRLRSRPSTEKDEIIRNAVEILNTEKIYSLSCCLSNEDYSTQFSDSTRRDHSQYELCFILAVIASARMSELNNYDGVISFVMDEGNSKAEHVRLGY